MNQIDKACVVGAGTMGQGIAFVLAEANIDVHLIDKSANALKLANIEINRLIKSSLSKSRITEYQAHKIASRISISTSLSDIKGADLLIEAVNEDLEIKRHIFAAAETLMGKQGILASNTSSLAIKSIAEGVLHQDRVIGLHFFNPPHIMKLLEIIVHKDTSASTIETAKMLAQILRKECIIVNDSPGFATSRLGISFALEAMRMLEQGVASVEDLDAAMKLGYGHPMGPLMLSDWVGLDVRLAISEQLYKTLNSAVFAPPNILRRMVRAGFLGKKSGTGFYEWDQGRYLGVSSAMVEFCSAN